MVQGSNRSKAMRGVICAAVLLMSGGTLRAGVVEPGFDLFATQPGTTFMGAPFQGVPLGTFNFGGTIGVKPVGDTDTIVQRLAPASAPTPPGGSSTIPIELVSLSLVSVNPINLGAGTNFYYITLQSQRGGPTSPGQMAINFDSGNGGGTFDSFFDVFFDVREGALNGPIVASADAQLTNSGANWDRTPPPGAVTIPGVNINLNGRDNTGDFWPIGPFSEQKITVVHVVSPATVGSIVPLPPALLPASALFGAIVAARAYRVRIARG